MPQYSRERVAVFAVSPDSVDVLGAFAEQHGISYPLLSDEGSRVIRRLGLLNRHIEEQQRFYGATVEERHRGLPYPGSFLLHQSGVVVDKQFEQTHRVRRSGPVLLEDLVDGAPHPAGTATSATPSGVTVTAGAGSGTYYPLQRLRLHVCLEIPPGIHVYAAPVPAGFVPLTIALRPIPGVSASEVALPAPRSLRLPGFDEQFLVHDGRVCGRVGFMIERNIGRVELKVGVRFQACDDVVCYPPSYVDLAVALEGLDQPA